MWLFHVLWLLGILSIGWVMAISGYGWIILPLGFILAYWWSWFIQEVVMGGEEDTWDENRRS